MDLGYAVPYVGNLYRRGATELKGEGFGITEYHNFASFLPNLLVPYALADNGPTLPRFQIPEINPREGS
jgi:hypothetical protein